MLRKLLELEAPQFSDLLHSVLDANIRLLVRHNQLWIFEDDFNHSNMTVVIIEKTGIKSSQRLKSLSVFVHRLHLLEGTFTPSSWLLFSSSAQAKSWKWKKREKNKLVLIQEKQKEKSEGGLVTPTRKTWTSFSQLSIIHIPPSWWKDSDNQKWQWTASITIVRSLRKAIHELWHSFTYWAQISQKKFWFHDAIIAFEIFQQSDSIEKKGGIFWHIPRGTKVSWHGGRL